MKNKAIQITTALSLSLLFLVGCENGTEATPKTEQDTMEMGSSVLGEMKSNMTNETKEHADTFIENKTESVNGMSSEELLDASKEAANDIMNN